MKNCLVLIDVQNGFITKETEYILTPVNNLLESQKFDFIIATRFDNKNGSPFQRLLSWYELSTEGEAKLYDSVEKAADLIINKNLYTAVTNKMLDFIKENKISDVFIAGIGTDTSVLKTAADFFEHGVRSYVLSEFTASGGGKDNHDAGLKVLKRLLGEDAVI